MPQRYARTFGATAILLAIVVAGLIQFANAEKPAPPQIAVSTTSDPTGDPTETGSTASPAPFTYKVGVLQGVSTSNFWKYNGTATSVWDAYVLAPTKASLYQLDQSSLQIEPEMAAQVVAPMWDEAGWKVLVHLRDGLAWSDGEPMDAGDWAFTFSVARRLNLGGNWATSFPSVVTAVNAVDSKTLLIQFSEKPGLEVWPYTVGTAPVMAEHFWAESVRDVESAAELYDIEVERGVAGGPLELVDVSPELVLSRRNPSYGGTAPDFVEYHVYETEEELVSALARGDIHTLLTPKGITAENASSLSGSPGVRTLTTPTFGVRYLGFNLDREPMSSIQFRNAVAYLIDRKAMVDEFAPTAEAASSVMSPSNAMWYDAERSNEIAERFGGTLKERLSSAIDGLKEIGYTWTVEPKVENGKISAGTGLLVNGVTPAPLTILTPGDQYDPARPRYAEELAAGIELLGYSVIPLETDFSTVVDLAFTPDEKGRRQFDMVLLGWSLGNPGLPSFYGEIFGANGVANNTGYSRRKMERLIERFRQSTTIEEAREIVWEMEDLIATDLPYLPLYSSNIIEAYREDLVAIDVSGILGGIQASLGAFAQVTPKPQPGV